MTFHARRDQIAILCRFFGEGDEHGDWSNIALLAPPAIALKNFAAKVQYDSPSRCWASGGQWPFQAGPALARQSWSVINQQNAISL
jgi:hypothetical protein